MVAVTWVHSGTGVKLPVAKLASALDGPLLVVDGVHALGVEPEPVGFCDVFVAGTHKWLGGPRGTGVIWARDWDVLSPVIPSFANAPYGAWMNGRAPHGSRRVVLHAGRLPLLRAPLGVGRSVCLAGRARSRGGG